MVVRSGPMPVLAYREEVYPFVFHGTMEVIFDETEGRICHQLPQELSQRADPELCQ